MPKDPNDFDKEIARMIEESKRKAQELKPEYENLLHQVLQLPEDHKSKERRKNRLEQSISLIEERGIIPDRGKAALGQLERRIKEAFEAIKSEQKEEEE